MHKTVLGEKLDIGKIVLPLAGNHVKRCLLVTNTKVGKLYAKSVSASLKKRGIDARTVILPDGERYKNLKSLEKLYSAAVKNGITRKCFALALGGGVTGDITGFFAAAVVNNNRISITRCPAGTLHCAGISRINWSTGFIGNIYAKMPPGIILGYAVALRWPIHFVAGRNRARRPNQICNRR